MSPRPVSSVRAIILAQPAPLPLAVFRRRGSAHSVGGRRTHRARVVTEAEMRNASFAIVRMPKYGSAHCSVASRDSHALAASQGRSSFCCQLETSDQTASIRRRRARRNSRARGSRRKNIYTRARVPTAHSVSLRSSITYVRSLVSSTASVARKFSQM